MAYLIKNTKLIGIMTSSKNQYFRKIITLIFAISILTCTFYPLSSVVASGCETIKTYTFENEEWSDVYYDKYGVSFLAKLPTYQGSFLQDESMFLYGSSENSFYRIEVYAFSPYFPNTGKDFKNLVQQLFPGASIEWLNAKKLGAKYATKLSYKINGKINYTRVVFANTNYISLQTDDINEARRNNFFDGFKVY